MGSLNVTGNNFSDAVRVFPNPSTGSFTVELPANAGVSSVTLTDIFGRIIEARITTNPVNTFEVKNVPPGTYVVKVENNAGTFREKINIW